MQLYVRPPTSWNYRFFRPQSLNPSGPSADFIPGLVGRNSINEKPYIVPGPYKTYVLRVPDYDFIIQVLQKVGFLWLRMLCQPKIPSMLVLRSRGLRLHSDPATGQNVEAKLCEWGFGAQYTIVIIRNPQNSIGNY